MTWQVVSVTLDVDPHFVSHPLPASQLQLPDHLQSAPICLSSSCFLCFWSFCGSDSNYSYFPENIGSLHEEEREAPLSDLSAPHSYPSPRSSMGGHGHGHVMSDGSIGPSGRHGLLSLGLDLGMASTSIWEYPRCEALLAYLRSQMEAEPALEVDDVDVAPRRTFGGGWDGWGGWGGWGGWHKHIQKWLKILRGFRDSHPQVLIGDESWILLSANPFLDGCWDDLQGHPQAWPPAMGFLPWAMSMAMGPGQYLSQHEPPSYLGWFCSENHRNSMVFPRFSRPRPWFLVGTQRPTAWSLSSPLWATPHCVPGARPSSLRLEYPRIKGLLGKICGKPMVFIYRCFWSSNLEVSGWFSGTPMLEQKCGRCSCWKCQGFSLA